MFSPDIESVDMTYRGPGADGGTGTACLGLTQSDTSCDFTIPQPGMYTVSVELTNSIGTTTASTSFQFCEDSTTIIIMNIELRQN